MKLPNKFSMKNGVKLPVAKSRATMVMRYMTDLCISIWHFGKPDFLGTLRNSIMQITKANGLTGLIEPGNLESYAHILQPFQKAEINVYNITNPDWLVGIFSIDEFIFRSGKKESKLYQMAGPCFSWGNISVLFPHISNTSLNYVSFYISQIIQGIFLPITGRHDMLKIICCFHMFACNKFSDRFLWYPVDIEYVTRHLGYRGN